MEPASVTIEGLGPLPVHRPASVAEAGEVVRQARTEGRAIYPLGGRTQLHVGRAPVRPGVGLDLTGLTNVIDYPARDMTITVQAGLRVAELERILAGENQRLPIDVPHADRATIGGILALNTSGPRRYGHGTLRDYLIGVSVLDDVGNETKAGGRVVKNVAGYDLCKLHIGALGTLGIITQATFKLRPRPAIVAGTVSGERLEAVLLALHTSRTRPVVVEILNGRARQSLGQALPEGEWVVVAGLEESANGVAWQTTQLLAELDQAGATHVQVVAGTASDPLWAELAGGSDTPAAVTLKANLLPSAVADFCRTLNRRPEGWAVQAHAGSGIVWAFAAESIGTEGVEATLRELLPLARQASGNVVLPRCPVAWKARLPIWGERRGDVVVMRKIKLALDPVGLFNPGRFLEGIES